MSGGSREGSETSSETLPPVSKISSTANFEPTSLQIMNHKLMERIIFSGLVLFKR